MGEEINNGVSKVRISLRTIIAMLSILGTVLGAGVPALFYVMDQRYQHNHNDTVTMIDQHVAMHKETGCVEEHNHEHGHQNVNDWQNSHLELHVNRNNDSGELSLDHYHPEIGDLEYEIYEHYHSEFDTLMEMLETTNEEFIDDVYGWLEALQEIVDEHDERLDNSGRS